MRLLAEVAKEVTKIIELYSYVESSRPGRRKNDLSRWMFFGKGGYGGFRQIVGNHWGEYDMQQTQLAARDRKLPRRFLRISFLCRFICYAEMNLGIINQNTIKNGLLFNSWRTCLCGCMWEV